MPVGVDVGVGVNGIVGAIVLDWLGSVPDIRPDITIVVVLSTVEVELSDTITRGLISTVGVA